MGYSSVKILILAFFVIFWLLLGTLSGSAGADSKSVHRSCSKPFGVLSNRFHFIFRSRLLSIGVINGSLPTREVYQYHRWEFCGKFDCKNIISWEEDHPNHIQKKRKKSFWIENFWNTWSAVHEKCLVPLPQTTPDIVAREEKKIYSPEFHTITTNYYCLISSTFQKCCKKIIIIPSKMNNFIFSTKNDRLLLLVPPLLLNSLK